MYIRKRVFWQHLLGLLLVIVLTAEGHSTSLQNNDVLSAHHNISATLIPTTHELAATDQIDLEVSTQVKSLTFTLAQTLRVESILLGQGSASRIASFTTIQLPDSFAQRIVVMLPEEHGRQVTLVWVYRGPINDPPKEPRHLRFVTPSETTGHIGLEGVYLSGESHWYPDVEEAFSTYRVTTQIPEGWTVVGSGQKVAENLAAGMVSSTWIVQERSEAFTLVANKFVTKSREWKHRRRGSGLKFRPIFAE
ncbi:MAG: M1 family metallopeptidase [Nitrospira sp.]|nr:M1 family metallopeptidase [Nitrospira sp.]